MPHYITILTTKSTFCLTLYKCKRSYWIWPIFNHLTNALVLCCPSCWWVHSFFTHATTNFSATCGHWINKKFRLQYWFVKPTVAYGHILRWSFICSHVSGHLKKKILTLRFWFPPTPEAVHQLVANCARLLSSVE